MMTGVGEGVGVTRKCPARYDDRDTGVGVGVGLLYVGVGVAGHESHAGLVGTGVDVGLGVLVLGVRVFAGLPGVTGSTYSS